MGSAEAPAPASSLRWSEPMARGSAGFRGVPRAGRRAGGRCLAGGRGCAATTSRGTSGATAPPTRGEERRVRDYHALHRNTMNYGLR